MSPPHPPTHYDHNMQLCLHPQPLLSTPYQPRIIQNQNQGSHGNHAPKCHQMSCLHHPQQMQRTLQFGAS